MSAPYATLYLTPTIWDLAVDASGNLAIATAPYSVVQDVASVCRTFYSEVYYDSTLGVQYLGPDPPTNEQGAILGGIPPLNILQSQMAAAALTVPGVATATVVLSSFSGRQVQGQVQITLEDETELTVPLG